MFCHKCGNQLTEGAVFCPKCGNKITSNMSHQTAPSQIANNVPYQTGSTLAGNNKSSKKSFKTKAAIIVIAVLLLSVYILWKNSAGTFEQALSGTWIASFGDGEYECRLQFYDSDEYDSGEGGKAMLVHFDKNGDSIGYFEVVYLGEVTFTETRENVDTKETSGVITLKNVGNPENSDHDFELPYMTINYTYNPKTKTVTLKSNFLADFFNYNIADNLSFTEHVTDHSYYANTGGRYYDWYFLN